MDKSEEYIAMCNCPEIQDRWISVHSTIKFWEARWANRVSQMLPMDTCYVKPLKYTQNILYLNYSDTGTYLYFGQGHRNFEKDECIWLPRQDQLQEMIGCKAGNHKITMLDFVRKAEYFYSLEQQWLGFVIYRLHNKKWSGSEWKEASDEPSKD